MNALRRAWEKEHGQGSVVGLAPSSSAAHVLAEDLGIATENTAKWWQSHLQADVDIQPGALPGSASASPKLSPTLDGQFIWEIVIPELPR